MLLLGSGFPSWCDQVMAGVVEEQVGGDPSNRGTSTQSSQTIEIFDAGGRRTGYGKVHGETVELFNTDGSRRGYGKVQGGAIELFNPDSTRSDFGRIGR